MRIGLQLFATRRGNLTDETVLHDTVALAELADELGFDVVWLAEHHGTDWNRCTDTLTLLAYIAARTQRIRLGSAVVNLVLQHPTAVAERALLLDAISGGRLELGIGRGFAPRDYAKFGVRTDDATTVFRAHHARLLTELRSADARHSIPIWLATPGSLATVELASRCGHGLLTTASGQKLSELTTQAAAHDGIPRVGVTRAVHLSTSHPAALEQAKPGLGWYIDALAALQPGSEKPVLADVVSTFCVLGSPDDCVREIGGMAALGVTDFTAVFGVGGVQRNVTEAVIRRFADEVMPRLRTAKAAADKKAG